MRLIGLSVLVFVVVALAGCGPSVHGQFFSRDGGLISEGPVVNGQTYASPGGARIEVSGAGNKDVRIEPISTVKSSEVDAGSVFLFLAGVGGVSLFSISLSMLAGESVERIIPPLETDLRVQVGDNFVFWLVRGNAEGEGQGEGQTEGEGELPPAPVVTITSPANNAVIQLSGDPPRAGVDLTASITGPVGARMLVTMVSPQGEVYPRTVTILCCGWSSVVTHGFGLNIAGYGQFSVQVENIDTGQFATASVNVEVLSPQLEEGEGEGSPDGEPEGQAEGEGQGEGQTEGEGQVEGEIEPLSVTMTSPSDGAVFTLAGTPPSVDVLTAANIGGSPDLGPIEIVMVSIEGKKEGEKITLEELERAFNDEKAYRQTVVAPATVSHTFNLTLTGSGLMSVRAKVMETGEVEEKTRAITVVKPTK